MNENRSTLLKGAVKSAVSSASGMILSLNIIDPDHFSFKTVGGWGNLLAAIGIAVVVAEARFWKQWADSSNGHTPPDNGAH